VEHGARFAVAAVFDALFIRHSISSPHSTCHYQKSSKPTAVSLHIFANAEASAAAIRLYKAHYTHCIFLAKQLDLHEIDCTSTVFVKRKNVPGSIVS